MYLKLNFLFSRSLFSKNKKLNFTFHLTCIFENYVQFCVEDNRF